MLNIFAVKVSSGVTIVKTKHSVIQTFNFSTVLNIFAVKVSSGLTIVETKHSIPEEM